MVPRPAKVLTYITSYICSKYTSTEFWYTFSWWEKLFSKFCAYSKSVYSVPALCYFYDDIRTIATEYQSVVFDQSNAARFVVNLVAQLPLPSSMLVRSACPIAFMVKVRPNFNPTVNRRVFSVYIFFSPNSRYETRSTEKGIPSHHAWLIASQAKRWLETVFGTPERSWISRRAWDI